jgi:predicted HTH domain antitoxin
MLIPMKVTVSIPDGLAHQLAKKWRPVENQLVLDLALHYYQQGVISLGKAAELSDCGVRSSKACLPNIGSNAQVH